MTIETVNSPRLPHLKASSCTPCLEKLDRLGWQAGLAFVSYGARFGIRVNDPEVLEHLLTYLPPRFKVATSPVVDTLYSLRVGGAGARRGVRRLHLLYVDTTLAARAKSLEEVFEHLESLLQLNVAVSARRKLFVHAGVVAWQGRVVVIPGFSMSGKTRLVEALVRNGATYYSDEYAVFDDKGRVHPYPKPLSVRKEGRPKLRLEAAELGGQVGREPLQVGMVVATTYKAGATWRPRALSPGEAALTLLNHTVLARLRPEFALKTLHEVVPDAMAYKGVRGEAEEVARSLLRRLEADLLIARPSLEHCAKVGTLSA